MLAHGIYLEHVAAVVFGLAGFLTGVWSLLRGATGRRGAILLAFAPLVCAALILAVAVSQSYQNLRGLADAGLLGYEPTLEEALSSATAEFGDGCLLLAGFGTLGLLVGLVPLCGRRGDRAV